ncbi:MAG: hypothetical protein ACOVOQ_15220 [Flavobacterium sp.]
MKKVTFVLLFTVLIFSCKEKVSKETNNFVKDSTEKKESNTLSKTVDTSYKQNTRLYANYFYLMPEKAVDEWEATSDEELTYKGKKFTFTKKLKFEEGFLKEVKLGNNYVEDSEIIIELYKEKYGVPEIESSKSSYNIEDSYVDGVIKITDRDYNPEIHKSLSPKEFSNYLKNQFLFYAVVSNKFQVLQKMDNEYFKLMRDVSKNEYVTLKVLVSLKDYKYTKIEHHKKYTWRDGDKIIVIHHHYKNDFIGVIGRHDNDKSLTVTYSSAQEDFKKNKIDSIDKLKEIEKQKKEQKEQEEKSLESI